MIILVKFDGIRMADLVEVQDPDKDGGITLVFNDNKFLHIKIVDGKIVTESRALPPHQPERSITS